MTGIQKQNIQNMRRQGLGYAHIASALGISKNTVKTFCRRNNLNGGDAFNSAESEENKEICKQCGKRLEQPARGKPKKFCGDDCRHAWWAANRENMKKKAFYSLTCACCGRMFESYGNKNRKYCTHACYIKRRYRDGRRADA